MCPGIMTISKGPRGEDETATARAEKYLGRVGDEWHAERKHDSIAESFICCGAMVVIHLKPHHKHASGVIVDDEW